ERASVDAAGHCSTAAAMDAVVSAGDASDGVEQNEYVFACFNHTSATFNHEARESNVSLQILVVRRSDDLRLHRTLEVGDFVGALGDEQHEDVNFRMVLGDSVGDLLQDGGLAGARRSDDEATGALPQRRDHVDHAGLDEVRGSLKSKFFDWIDCG